MTASAATLTWDGGGASASLSDPLNWNPDQTPGIGDDLVIGLNAFPFATADVSVRNIYASRSGIRNGTAPTFSNPSVSYRILVQDTLNFQTRNNSDHSLWIDGVSGSGLLASPGLSLGNLILDNDNGGEGVASLRLNSIAVTDTTPERTALALVAGQIDVGTGGAVEGSGVVVFAGTSATVPGLVNNGQLIASYAGPPLISQPPPATELRLLSSIPSRPVDLDGDGSESGVVRVQDHAALRISQPLADPMSNQIELGDGATLWMERPWVLEDDLLAISAPSAFGAVPDVARLSGAQVTLSRQPGLPGAISEPELFVAFGNRLVAEADIVMLDGRVQVSPESVFEAAGSLWAESGTTVISGGRFEVTGVARFDDGSALQLFDLGLPGPNAWVAPGGVVEFQAGSGAGADMLEVGRAEVAAGGTLRFFGNDEFGTNVVQFAAGLTVAGRLEVEGAFGLVSRVGTIEAFVGELTLTDDATYATSAGFDDAGVRNFGTLIYRNEPVSLDGTLELSLDPAAAADPSLLDGFVATLFAANSSGPGLLPEVLGTFDHVRVVSGPTQQAVPGLFASVQYNVPFEDDGVMTTVTFRTIAALAGDYNASGSVEQADLDLVLTNWGGPRTFEDGVTAFATPNVDQEELDVLLTNWGSTSSPSFLINPSVVPEPTSGLLVVGLLAGCRRYRGAA